MGKLRMEGLVYERHMGVCVRVFSNFSYKKYVFQSYIYIYITLETYFLLRNFAIH